MSTKRKAAGRAPRARGEALTREQVVAAAVRLVDEVGLERFTMRALAGQLGTYPATIYWHAGTRLEVLALVAHRVLGEIDVPAPGSGPWREWLATVARSYRRVLHAHPAVATYFASQMVVTPPSLPLTEAILATLAAAGFAGTRLAHAYNAYVGSLVGWVSVELSNAPPGEAWQSNFEETVRQLADSPAHPTIASNHAMLADRILTLRWHTGTERPLDDSFEVALDVWLSGLDASLSA